MEKRKAKRLLIFFAVCIIFIMLFKMVITDTYTTLTKAAVEKKNAAVTKPLPSSQQASAPLPAAEISDSPASSVASDTASRDSPAASSVNDAQ